MINPEFFVAESGPYSLGTLIAAPLCLLIGLACVGLGVFLVRNVDAIGGAIAIVLGLAFFIGVGAFMWPYSGEYHQWRTVSGTVERIDGRLYSPSADSGPSERYVITFADSDNAKYACDDTRCASVDEGDLISLSCKREWAYTGTDGYGCKFEAVEPR